MKLDLNWDLLRVFLAVANSSSLSQAATDLRLSQPTVGRHLDALEECLGVSLVLRSSKGISLTDKGSELARSVSSIGDNIQGFLRLATGAQQELSGSVRLAATDVFGIEVLLPMLARLQQSYSGISVELVLDNRDADLLRGEADIAVRMAAPTQSELIGCRLGEVPVGLFATEEYLDRHPPLEGIDDLLDHRLIGFDSRGPMATLFRQLDPRLTTDRFHFRCDNLMAQVEAAKLGQGIAGLQTEVAQRHACLCPVLPNISLPVLPIWLVIHKDIRRGAHIRALFNGLKKELSVYLR